MGTFSSIYYFVCWNVISDTGIFYFLILSEHEIKRCFLQRKSTDAEWKYSFFSIDTFGLLINDRHVTTDISESSIYIGKETYQLKNMPILKKGMDIEFLVCIENRKLFCKKHLWISFSNFEELK